MFRHQRVQLLGAVLAFCVLGFSSACNLIYDFEKPQCATDKDCTDRGGPYAGTQCVQGYCESVCEGDEDCDSDFACVESHCTSRWACLDEELEPASSSMVRLSTSVTSITGDPLANIELLLCSNVDPSCDAPVARLQTDDKGFIEFEAATTVGGYLQTEVPGFFPQMNFLPTVLEDEMVLPTITLSPEQTISTLAQFVGAAPDPDRGHIVLSLASCTGEAPGVEITASRADEESILYFVNGGFPTADLERTTKDGSGGFLNFRTGNATVTLVSEAGRDIAQLSFTVRKGTLSVLRFQPNSLYESTSDESEATK